MAAAVKRCAEGRCIYLPQASHAELDHRNHGSLQVTDSSPNETSLALIIHDIMLSECQTVLYECVIINGEVKRCAHATQQAYEAHWQSYKQAVLHQCHAAQFLPSMQPYSTSSQGMRASR